MAGNNRVLLRGNSPSGKETGEEIDNYNYRGSVGGCGSTLEIYPTQPEGQGGFSKLTSKLRGEG